MLTASLRHKFHSNSFSVNLPQLISLAAGKGYLAVNGASLRGLGHLASSYGIPVVGEIPGHPDLLGEGFALGTSITGFRSSPMPVTLTSEAAEKCMNYREHLCDCLDIGPVVLSYALQAHYGDPREPNELYRRRAGDSHYVSLYSFPWSWTRQYHSVTAYGYHCPNRNVSSLKIRYQENIRNAPHPEPGRHWIHPDAVDRYYIPCELNNLQFSDTPASGYRLVGS